MVLEKLELLAEDGIHLLNAGAVLFCNSTMNDVQMAKFATDVKATFTDIRREDRGSIIGLSKVCEQYIIDAMDWKADIIGLKRIKDLCDEAECKVEFRMELDDFVVVFYRNLREGWNNVKKTNNLGGPPKIPPKINMEQKMAEL